MKIILIGYPGSQHIVPASKYLVNKYLPGFDFHYLNYGGPKERWSEFIATYLKQFDDEFVILALDDYLISSPIDQKLYQEALDSFKKDPRVVSAKLCETTLEEHQDYPVTTQYTIWKREFLMALLKETRDPWHFEMTGSSIFKDMQGQALTGYFQAIHYDVHSCLSARWYGIKLDGVKQEDQDFIKNNHLIV